MTSEPLQYPSSITSLADARVRVFSKLSYKTGVAQAISDLLSRIDPAMAPSPQQILNTMVEYRDEAMALQDEDLPTNAV